MTKIILTSIAIAILGVVPFMGIPGVLVLILSKPFVYLLYGPMAFESFEQSLGDGAWPLMIMLSLLWPVSIPIAYALSQKIFGELPFFSMAQLVPFCAFVLLGTTIISSAVVTTNSSMKRLTDAEVLEQAIKSGKLSLVKKHLNSAADTSYDFGDPLYVALENKQTKVALYLLDNGANPEKYAKETSSYEPGFTPLHTAARGDLLEVMQKLLDLGVNPDIQSADGRTPLHTLGKLEKETLAVIELLKSHNANFAAVDHEGNTPVITLAMIHAPLDYRPVLVGKLIEYGCPKDAKNKNGHTALDIVQDQQPYEIELIEVLK